VKPSEVVLQGGAGAPEPEGKTRDVRDPALDALRAQAYLTADQAAVYVACPTRGAFYKWRSRSGVRTYRRGRRVMFKRRDLDEALQPAEERGRRHFFSSVRKPS
jgi:excisionase family DNA binding protein